MKRTVYVGIDGGGGSTECRLADAVGNLVGLGHGGGSNLASAGEDGVSRSLANAIRDAGLDEDDVVPCASLGLSGAIPEGENPQLEGLARKLLPQADKIIITNDAVNALAGAFCLEPGICVNSGTGTFGIGRNSSGKLAFASGWGALVGDEGSGYWIGIHALTAVIKSHDHRGPETMLSKRLLKTLQADSLEQAVLSI
jgi:N-acetylglucosamine kinase-like BadF-type ATPase